MMDAYSFGRNQEDLDTEYENIKKAYLEIFKELNDQDGVSILMVTHDPMIASYSQKLLYIKDGVIAKQVVKGDLTQKEYFHKIVDVNSAESMSLFEGE